MSHQDQVCSRDRSQVRLNADYLERALQWLLGQVDWSRIGWREDCRWTPLRLAATALLWAWSDEATLGERFFAARRLANHLYQPQREFAASWQAFIKLLGRWNAPLIVAIQATIRRRMQDALAASWTVHDFVVFGVDGVVASIYLAPSRTKRSMDWRKISGERKFIAIGAKSHARKLPARRRMCLSVG